MNGNIKSCGFLRNNALALFNPRYRTKGAIKNIEGISTKYMNTISNVLYPLAEELLIDTNIPTNDLQTKDARIYISFEIKRTTFFHVFSEAIFIGLLCK